MKVTRGRLSKTGRRVRECWIDARRRRRSIHSRIYFPSCRGFGGESGVVGGGELTVPDSGEIRDSAVQSSIPRTYEISASSNKLSIVLFGGSPSLL